MNERVGMTPNNMPGAVSARPKRRVRVEYDAGPRGGIRLLVGRLLVDAGEATGIFMRSGTLEVRGEWPSMNDWTLFRHRLISVEFVDPSADVAEIVAEAKEFDQ